MKKADSEKMKFRICSSFLLLAIFCIVISTIVISNIISGYQQQALAQNSTLPKGFSTYVNTTYGIKIQYPSDWIIKGGNRTGTQNFIATFMPSNTAIPEITLYKDKTCTFNLNQYLSKLKSVYSSLYANVQLSNSPNNITANDNTTYTISAWGKHPILSPANQSEVRTLEKGLMKGEDVYSIQFRAKGAQSYQHYLPTFQKMFSSLDINNVISENVTGSTNDTRTTPDFCQTNTNATGDQGHIQSTSPTPIFPDIFGDLRRR
jgi:hypothetical protein